MKLHIGERIKKRARELRIGPTELGLLINTSKQNIYGIFKRKSLDTELLWKVSVALKYDFFASYTSELEGNVKEVGQMKQYLKKCREDLQLCKDNLDNYKKQVDYLEKINRLLEEKIRGN
ncbi:MAG: hypothetical protein H6581_12585 [Bacteroidia bacterium]|nr:hypothetical protein [Bacteroidia bacterium]